MAAVRRPVRQQAAPRVSTGRQWRSSGVVAGAREPCACQRQTRGVVQARIQVQRNTNGRVQAITSQIPTEAYATRNTTPPNGKRRHQRTRRPSGAARSGAVL